MIDTKKIDISDLEGLSETGLMIKIADLEKICDNIDSLVNPGMFIYHNFILETSRIMLEQKQDGSR